MRTRMHPLILAAALVTLACGEGEDVPESGLGADTAAQAANRMLSPPGGAVDLGEPLLASPFQRMEADTADEVTGILRLYADAGPAEGAAATDAPTKSDSLMDRGPAEDPGTALETAGVESPMAGTGGGFRVEVVLDGLSPGGHAWHIHSAECGRTAPIVVPFTRTAESPGIAQPLSADVSGAARALVTVPARQLSQEQLRSGRYSVHVHRGSGVDHGPTVACADLF